MSREAVLVDADWVEEHLDDPNVVLVEVDEDTTAYDEGPHPWRRQLDWKNDLQDPVRRDFVNKEQFEQLLSAAGIGNDDTVVLYGGNNNWFAAYAYWYFKLYGHDERQAARRRPQEVGARQPGARPVERADPRRRPATRPNGAGPGDPGVPRRGRRGDRQPSTWSTSARPDEFAGRAARAGAPAAGAGAARRVTSRPLRTSRGARRPTTTARSVATTS